MILNALNQVERSHFNQTAGSKMVLLTPLHVDFKVEELEYHLMLPRMAKVIFQVDAPNVGRISLNRNVL